MFEKLVKERVKRGISQYELAKNIGITNIYLCNLEKEKSEPSIKTLRKWCDSLNLEFYISFRKRKN